jgi:hypothetical protein
LNDSETESESKEDLRVERGFTIDDQTDPSKFQTLHGSVEQLGRRLGPQERHSQGGRKIEGKLLFQRGGKKKKRKKEN